MLNCRRFANTTGKGFGRVESDYGNGDKHKIADRAGVRAAGGAGAAAKPAAQRHRHSDDGRVGGGADRDRSPARHHHRHSFRQLRKRFPWAWTSPPIPRTKSSEMLGKFHAVIRALVATEESHASPRSTAIVWAVALSWRWYAIWCTPPSLPPGDFRRSSWAAFRRSRLRAFGGSGRAEARCRLGAHRPQHSPAKRPLPLAWPIAVLAEVDLDARCKKLCSTLRSSVRRLWR